MPCDAAACQCYFRATKGVGLKSVKSDFVIVSFVITSCLILAVVHLIRIGYGIGSWLVQLYDVPMSFFKSDFHAVAMPSALTCRYKTRVTHKTGANGCVSTVRFMTHIVLVALPKHLLTVAFDFLTAPRCKLIGKATICSGTPRIVRACYVGTVRLS